MRFTRYTIFAMLVGAMLLTPGSAPAAASKEMQDLYREIGELSDQIKDMQKASDGKFASLQAQLQQALETANRTNSGVTSMNASVTQTLSSELRTIRDQLSSVTGLSAKVDGVSNDVSDLRGTIQGLQTTVNRQQQMLSDILNQVKLVQAPPAAPPPGTDAGVAPGGIAASPQPSGQELFNTAVHDQNGGKPDIALTEYAEFLKLYPNDGNAIRAQEYIGEIHYAKSLLIQAVKDFDAVIEQYQKDPVTTPTAYYMKGMALKQAKKNTEAIRSFEDVTNLFPHAPEAAQARQQLTAMGVPAPLKRKK